MTVKPKHRPIRRVGPHKFYEGIPQHGPTDNGGKVMVAGLDDPYELPIRLDIRNHSPTGFAWGYEGSGPAQLALALLADVCGDDDIAREHHQLFKAEFVASLPDGAWQATAVAVQAWLDAVLGQDATVRDQEAASDIDDDCPTRHTQPWL